jgi:hypothetical protein
MTVAMASDAVQKPNGDVSDSRRELLRSRAHAFCQSLVSPPMPEELLKEYFTPGVKDTSPVIREHGPSWVTTHLPFLGRDFLGVDACVEYFDLLAASLRMHLDKSSFPGLESFTVDADLGRVSVVGKGRFESTETKRSWEEKFTYVLSGWDEQGRMGRWDIWADPLSAWAAISETDIDGWKKGEHRPLISVQQRVR